MSQEPPHPARPRRIAGWTAVALNTITASIWAFWGAIEMFHEGWWQPALIDNLITAPLYLIPAVIFIALGLIAIRFPRLGAAIVLAFTIWFWWWWNVPARLASGTNILPALAMSGVGGLFAILWWWGRPTPRKWAARITCILPIAIALISAAEPAYRVATRHDDGKRIERTIVGNEITLTWAPPGPGWPTRGASWRDAQHAAAHLSIDGARLEQQPLNAWRLPTIDELARSMTRDAENAGGRWIAESARTHFETPPDKETPLWNPTSQIIYFWTASEVDDERAWSIAYNGRPLIRNKQNAMGTLAYRLVRATRKAP